MATEITIREQLNFGSDCLKIWGTDGTVIDVSLASLGFFDVPSKEIFHKRYDELSPQFQPNGKPSKTAMLDWVTYTFEQGVASFDWLYKKLDGRHMDCCTDVYNSLFESKSRVRDHLRKIRML